MPGSSRRLSLFAALGLIAACAEGPEAPGQDERAADSEHPPTARPWVVDDLRRAHEAPRHPSDGGGRAWLEVAEGETTDVVAGRAGRWTIVYEAGTEGVAVDGFVRLTVPRFWGWSPAQLSYERYPGYTTATCDAEGVTLEPQEVAGFWVEFGIQGRALAAGERVTIVYGAGTAGAVADRYAESDSRLWISVDGDGDGHASLLVDSPGVRVLAGSPRTLAVVMPSTAEPGDEVLLSLSVLDALGNAGIPFEGEVELAVIPDGLAIPTRVSFTAEEGGNKRIPIQVEEAGVYRLLARTSAESGEIRGQSNPLLVEEGVAPIRWADLHGHSNLSDGTGTPAEFLKYARDVAGLDVVCLTDHDHWGMLFLDEHPDVWEHIRAEALRFHEPGRFVSLLGYEWTNWIHGHRHVLYFEEEGAVLSSIDEDYETPQQLWDALAGEPALTFAHHSAGGPIATNWDYVPPPELEPVTEVASVHGASEAADAPYRIYDPLRGNFVRHVLDRGLRLGFIGSGDSHDGHPGLAHYASPSGSGLAALLTDDLTRDGVYRTLRSRRTYATNGERMILRAALDGAGMGTSIAPKAEALLYVRVIGSAPITSIEVIRSGKVIESLPGDDVWDLATTTTLEDLESGEYVYVRAIQGGRGAAWSSPFFVE